MFAALRKRMASLPTPLAGLALGLAGLGIALECALPLNGLAQNSGILAAACLTLLVTLKFLFNPGILLEEFRHPVLCSIMPTYHMTLMLMAKKLCAFSQAAGEALWVLALILYIPVTLAFIHYRIKSFDLKQMVPSWFLPFAGILIAGLTFPTESYRPFAYFMTMFGMFNYGVILVVLLYRLIFLPEVPEAARPTIAILAAPASLSLVSYLCVQPEPSLFLCSVLLGVAVLMTALIYLAFAHLLRLPFTPGMSAYTFPTAIGATALYTLAAYLEKYPDLNGYISQLKFLAGIETVVAVAVIGYVCLRYAVYYLED